MNKNQDLERRINEWTEQARNAKKPDDLHAVTQAMVDYGSPIRFQLRNYYLAAAAFAVLAVWLGFEVLGSRFHPQWLASLGGIFDWSSGATGMVLAGMFGGLAVIATSIAFKKENLITKLTNAIMHRASLIHYGLEPINSDEVARLEKSFGDLRWGNYKRSFHDCYQGDYQGEEHRFTYQPFRLHYVDEETKQEYDHVNKRWETKKVYHHYDRSGIVVDFPYAKGLHICQAFASTLYGKPYKPSSLEFDKAFHCRGKDAETLSRFLKPATVQSLSEAARELPRLSIEVNEDGKMCLGCGHRHVVQSIQNLTRETNPRISPEGFDKFIRASVEMPRLDKLNALAHTLIRYSDSNFSRKTA
ncbi:MAG: hypothetical protein COB05_17770 [Marinobacter sp.]|jgi:hypothetical protein|nr:MAG: hypothetical protein COB05_17770 [Marinobacter sp.]